MASSVDPARRTEVLHAAAAPERGRRVGIAAAWLMALGVLALGARPAMAADVTMNASVLLGGHVRPGAWTAISVDLANDGPPITGELQLAGKQSGRSSYATLVDLPTNARKSYTLYAHSPVLGGKLDLALVVGEQPLLTSSVQVTGHDPYQPIVVVVAERPQGIVPDITAGLDNPNGVVPAVITLAPGALPGRVEAWTAIDRLVWQDVDSARLDVDQLAALSAWVGAGGQLVIVGGTTGTTTLAAFPAELLPYRPRGTVDAAPADLAALFGTVPTGATPMPAVEGTLSRGSVLARSGDGIVAAQASVGAGTVSLIGFNPATAWLKGTAAARALWHRVLPIGIGPVLNPLTLPDDSQIVAALNQLPSVDLPPIDQLFLLLLGYIALVGPLNYLVLRRLDRREWAWVTMPLLVAVFAFAAYTLGVNLKGSDVIVNEVGIVRGAQGADRGLGQIYVGLFSPTRSRYDVRVPGGALLSNSIQQLQPGAVEQPLDVTFGDPSRLRGFAVGPGQLRSFRAETTVAAPRIESDLRFDAGRLRGTITNRSDTELQAGAVVFGGGVALLGVMAPGSTQTLDIAVGESTQFTTSLSDRLYGSQFNLDQATARVLYTRRAVIDQLTGYGIKFGQQSAGLGDSPVLIAWRPKPAIDVDVGDERATHVGETMFMTTLDASTGGTAILSSELVRHTVIASDAADAMDQGAGFSLGRGTMVVEYRGITLQGTFGATKLTLQMTQGEQSGTLVDGKAVDPLPDAQQPPQDDPLGDRSAGQPADGLPDFQLWDRVAAKWSQFQHSGPVQSLTINHPERYLDMDGSMRVRFVNAGDGAYFDLLVRMEGTVS